MNTILSEMPYKDPHTSIDIESNIINYQVHECKNQDKSRLENLYSLILRPFIFFRTNIHILPLFNTNIDNYHNKDNF